ncbi:bacterial peptide chain release factor 1 [Wolfiporia cocos MD-104 SS10]|uniref:Bacterial peptide chain release factor 1 n=1 Tax=Wolfiporia cocos (strain MD-104) TaxID=742152 RepID=A0A2H3JVT5_WOLCO|nr:bacterial peptide chain release factor 1 [Wolfiporia cocos MD-104 SS10]
MRSIALPPQLSPDFSRPEDISIARRIHELEPLDAAWQEWSRTRQSLHDTLPLLQDADPTMRTLAEEEHGALSGTLARLVGHTFPALLVPPSTTAHLSALVELKVGVGGSEAALFLADLMRMYTRAASVMGWRATVVTGGELDTGGLKDAMIEIKGGQAYDLLRWESGVHRVQRVPATEANGRVHTSTVAVVVLPLTEETDQQSKEEELFTLDEVRIDVMRARGAGGQHVNKTESAVRLTHIPTGITVSMQDERSQHQNRRRAFQVLRARLMDRKISQEIVERKTVRKNLVPSRDRSEKIRTYNYAQDRVTDHRIGLSVMNLMSVMEGEGLQDILKALEERHHSESLEEVLVQL